MIWGGGLVLYPSRVGHPASPTIKPRPRWTAAVLKTEIPKRLQFTSTRRRTHRATVLFMDNLHIFDIVVLVLVGWLTLRGGMRGFVTQLTSIASIFISWIVAVKFSSVVAPMLPVDAPWNRPIAMLLLFVGTSIVVWLLHGFIEGIISAIRLKNFDRHLGAILGLAKGLLLCMIITFFAVTVSEKTKNMVLDSVSGKYFIRGISTVASLIPNDVYAVLQKNLEGLKQYVDIAGELDKLKEFSDGDSEEKSPLGFGSIGDNLQSGFDRITSAFSATEDVGSSTISQPQTRIAESRLKDYWNDDDSTQYSTGLEQSQSITPYHPGSGSYLPVIPRR